ncbi:unnamed protein product [Blepharisma stoltei]|uniref:Uncharacterized protein n=1 Tax=Blepharisma stoltei TaxID=1481888 RepID=A0AAU9JSX4_9CILI|nr:unnamed protein product [Blepharisma stoltei]
MEVIYNSSAITNFLSLYSRKDWPNCILAVLLLGLSKLNGKQYTVEELWDLVENGESLNSELQGSQYSNKEEIITVMPKTLNPDRRYVSAPKREFSSQSTITNKPPLNQKTPKSSIRGSLKSEETPRFKVRDDKLKQSNRSDGSPNLKNSRLRTSPNVSPSRKENAETRKRFSPRINTYSHSMYNNQNNSAETVKQRTIPKYLKGVDSKIRDDILRDIASYKNMIDISKIEDQKIPVWDEEPTEEKPLNKNLNSVFQEVSKTNFGVQTELPWKEQESQTTIDFSDTQAHQHMESASVLLEESRNNSMYGQQMGISLNASLEGTFKKSGASIKDSLYEIPFDKDFETPRLPMEALRGKQQTRDEEIRESRVKFQSRQSTEEDTSELIQIANNFLENPLMIQLRNKEIDSFESSMDSLPNYTKSQPVPPLDLLNSSEVNIDPPFNLRWEKAIKSIVSKNL